MYDGPQLTAMRRRTTYEPMGDIPELFAIYEKQTGKKIERQGLRHQTVISATAAVLGAKAVLEDYLQHPTGDGDYVQYLNWGNNSTKQGFEGIAEVMGYTVPELAPVQPITTVAHGALSAARATVESLDHSDSFAQFRRRTLVDGISYLERVAAYGDQFSSSYLGAAQELLGRRPVNVLEADAEWERYVLGPNRPRTTGCSRSCTRT
jgi:hypothetical protein